MQYRNAGSPNTSPIEAIIQAQLPEEFVVNNESLNIISNVGDDEYYERIKEQLVHEVEKNDRPGLWVGENTSFTSPIAQTVPVDYYITRLFKYMHCKRECYIFALVYIVRFCQAMKISIYTQNFHRIFIISVTLAAKYLDDTFYRNSYYAEIGGLPLIELNALELEFLQMTHFGLFLETEMFYFLYDKLLHHVPLFELIPIVIKIKPYQAQIIPSPSQTLSHLHFMQTPPPQTPSPFLPQNRVHNGMGNQQHIPTRGIIPQPQPTPPQLNQQGIVRTATYSSSNNHPLVLGPKQPFSFSRATASSVSFCSTAIPITSGISTTIPKQIAVQQQNLSQHPLFPIGTNSHPTSTTSFPGASAQAFGQHTTSFTTSVSGQSGSVMTQDQMQRPNTTNQTTRRSLLEIKEPLKPRVTVIVEEDKQDNQISIQHQSDINESEEGLDEDWEEYESDEEDGIGNQSEDDEVGGARDELNDDKLNQKIRDKKKEKEKETSGIRSFLRKFACFPFLNSPKKTQKIKKRKRRKTRNNEPIAQTEQDELEKEEQSTAKNVNVQQEKQDNEEQRDDVEYDERQPLTGENRQNTSNIDEQHQQISYIKDSSQ